jgi:hypothetical protein
MILQESPSNLHPDQASREGHYASLQVWQLLSCLHVPAILSHPRIFFGRERTGFERGEVFIELRTVPGTRERDVYVGTRETKTVA